MADGEERAIGLEGIVSRRKEKSGARGSRSFIQGWGRNAKVEEEAMLDFQPCWRACRKSGVDRYSLLRVRGGIESPSPAWVETLDPGLLALLSPSSSVSSSTAIAREGISMTFPEGRLITRSLYFLLTLRDGASVPRP